MNKNCIKCGTMKNVNFDGMCKECYEKSVNNTKEKHEDIQNINKGINNKIVTIFKEKFSKETIKTITIVLLIILLFCYANTGSTKRNVELSHQVEDLTNQICKLNTDIDNNNNKLEENEKKITNLKNEKNILEQEKSKLENEKGSLEKEKLELITKVEELEKLSVIKNTIPATEKSSNSQNQKSSNSTTSSNAKSSSTNSKATKSNVVQNTNSEMVWVGKTGTKYHKQTCSTLKGKGHQITMQQALSEGRTACKVCH